MQTYLSTHVHCTQCDFYFVDAEARSEHVESSSSHPLCEPCSRRFLNENSLSFRHKCAAPHLPSKQSEEDLLDGNEVILNWAKDSINESLSYFPIMEDDYWSSESEDADSNSSSTSDSGNGDSDDETEYHVYIGTIQFHHFLPSPHLLIRMNM
ncbi:hypothetical protein C8R44DRAFT_889788 [Mycena epipterygia]|nr:hypothetical protein C8R44DRAFT_889788 [Mycena epipterygia]